MNRIIRITLLLLLGLATSIDGSTQSNEATLSDYAPNFLYTDATGETQELHDLKGKVVYISFWASWCQPCIQGFKKYADTRKDVANLGVIMLNISIDRDHHDWRQAMDRLNVPGLHGIVNKMDLIDDYELYSIPHYEIVGHDGKRLYLDREGGKTIVDNFKDFLARQGGD